MEPERWKRVEALFHRAADLGTEARAAFLDAECGGDRDLRARVERLLRDDRTGEGLLDRLEAQTRAALEDPMLGRTIGAYRLVARVAVGGMGVVYRAERTDGLFEHEVAVKLIRSERATEGMMRRFEQERRTLAATSGDDRSVPGARPDCPAQSLRRKPPAEIDAPGVLGANAVRRDLLVDRPHISTRRGVSAPEMMVSAPLAIARIVFTMWSMSIVSISSETLW